VVGLYREVDYEFYSVELLRQLPKGVFLSTRNGSTANTTTIGWASIGIMWGMPIFTGLVRPSSFSYGLIEKTGEFTISIPLGTDFSDELLLCGRTSGESIDKFSECNLTAMKSKTLETYIVGDCELHLDCKVIMKNETKEDSFPEKIKNVHYRQDDFHNIYFAEIVAAYVID